MLPQLGRLTHLLVIFVGLAIAACAHTSKDLARNIRPGMDKADVLEIAGNPIRTDRQHGHDRWAYPAQKNGDRTEVVYVFFFNGKVQYVGAENDIRNPSAPKDAATKMPEKFQNIEN